MTGAPTGRDIAYRGFRLPADLGLGAADGVAPGDGGGTVATPARQLDHGDPAIRYDAASWTSPPVETGFPVREVIPSWTADTPPGCWLRVELRGWHAGAPTTGWYVLADWAADDATLPRTSVPGQRDGDARVETDTLVVADATVTGWQARVTLLRPAGGDATPVLRTVGAVASGRHEPPTIGAHRALPGRAGHGRVIEVPRFSQRRHADGETRWGGGGDSWCSPTCVSMVLDFWAAGPAPDRYAWVTPPGPRPVVVHAARHCYDHAYAGAGNWPFNTAYAGLHGMDAFVTRLRSLAEAEEFVAAGVPLIVSAAFRAGEMPGLDYDTRGHLMVLVGFTVDGDPVLNDPYAPDDDAVRRTVDRDRFEAAWQAGSGGVAYVIRPASVPLPPAPAQANW
ncbi:Peptidase_C39 like family protein [Micromonospora rhizosphaerae]|uniref:Peptidase_C39 like family protein n=1 Tax=Micromonospora rhizosphaerae TaxID=568872 RepID=A0A1C6RYT7_9ACTN|nr:peptidase C39 family protein [Micromonospora rhizosphaerae]SCL22192.1 Peptidase_C39 like family protein [Micromonospora rhizosphaerae]